MATTRKTAVRTTARKLVDAANTAFALAAWLKPGELAFRVGMLRNAIGETARLVHEQLEALREECIVVDTLPLPEHAPDGAEPERRRRETTLADGTRDYVYHDRDEFKRREREILEHEITLDVWCLLEMQDARHIQADRLEAPTVPGIGVPDFALLAPFIRETATIIGEAP